MSGGGKETPRQAMIGMMYLFYTALLALNVSAEILTAFTLVDGSLRKTNTITEGVIESTQTEFAKAMTNNPAGTKKYNDLATGGSSGRQSIQRNPALQIGVGGNA